MNMFDKINIPGLGHAMHTSSRKNAVIAKNIANVDTPGYKAEKLEFEEVMGEYFSGGKKLPLKKTNDAHIESPNIRLSPEDHVRRQNNPSIRNDGNDVNPDYEMSEMAQNGVLYQELAQITGFQFSHLRAAVQGRS